MRLAGCVKHRKLSWRALRESVVRLWKKSSKGLIVEDHSLVTNLFQTFTLNLYSHTQQIQNVNF